MRRVLAQQRDIAGVTTLVSTAPIAMAAAVSGIISRRHRWDHLVPTDGVFTICTAMCGSGCKIVGTGITRGHLLMGLHGLSLRLETAVQGAAYLG